MTVKEIAEKLNEMAIIDGYYISQLPELRKFYLNKQILPNKIFTSHTIFDHEDKYAFHHGGRDEIQFNFGEEILDGVKYIRCGLCFSLEASHSLPDPVNDLEPFRKRYDECLTKYPHYFDSFRMWYFSKGIRYGENEPHRIPDSWFQYGNFICLGVTTKKPLEEISESDITWILEQFDRLMPIYEYCVLGNKSVLTSKRIFTRLTSNTNNWELPSPHKWKIENQGKKNIPFENQYGFGHEEWLLNQRFNHNGFQYGFIRGVENSNDRIKYYKEIHLYTVKRDKHQNAVYYLGHIRNVEVIRDDPESQKLIGKLVKQYNSEMIKEIEIVNADPKGIIRFPFKPIVRFRLSNLRLFDEPLYQPNFDLKKFKRFQPYKLEGAIEDVFQTDTEYDSEFVSGKSIQTTVFNRRNKESSVTVEKLHSEIIDALEKYLAPKFSLAKNNISIEIMRFHGNIADVVVRESQSEISIYEIKTTSSGRRNIRDAVAQLLDYALHTKYSVKKMMIVSPVFLTASELEFLRLLKETIDIPIVYLCYKKERAVQFMELDTPK